MGLDNIPEPYPCEGKETTIRAKDDSLIQIVSNKLW